MNKLTLVVAQCFFAIAVWAQLPNAGFENWTNQGLYEEPQGWTSNNGLYPYDPPALRDSLMVTEGHYSLQLIPGCPSFEFYHCPGFVKTTIPIIGQIPVFIQAQGACITGNLGISGSCEAEIKLISGGQVVSSSITYIDSTICQTPDCLENLPDLIRPLSFTVNPTGISQADAMEIEFRAIPVITGTGGGLALFYLDELSLDYATTATNETARNELALIIAPNPAQDILNGTLPQAADLSLSLYDLSGKCLLQQSFTHTSSFQLDISALAAGVYALEARDVFTRVVRRMRIVKTR